MPLGSVRSSLAGARLVRQAGVALGCATAVWMIFMRHFGPADLNVFLRAGRAVSGKVSPYVSPSSPALWSGHAFVYPYVVAWVFVPFRFVSVAAAGALFYGASVAAVWTTVRILAGPGAGLLPVALALTAEPVVRSVQLGTLNVWLLLGLAVAWRFRSRSTVLVVALTAVIIAKLFLFPMLVWLAISHRRRAAAVTGLLAAAVVTIGCAMADLNPATYERMLSVLSGHEGPHSSSITGALVRLHAGETLAAAGAMIIAALIIGAGWALARRHRNEAYVFSAGVLASLAASPIVWSHYFTLLLLIPLVLHWRPRSQVIAWGVSWLLGTPGGAPALRALQPIHWVVGICAAVAVLVVVIRRFVPSAVSAPPTLPPSSTSSPEALDRSSAGQAT